MRYSSIRKLDVSNGEGIGIALFVQGCPFNPHCKNCFNPNTWDFSGGKEWTKDVKEEFLNLADKPYITRITILGGEPLAKEHIKEIFDLVFEIRTRFGNTKTIWLYTGYTLEEIMNNNIPGNDIRQNILKHIDVLVDGRYVDELKDYTLKFRGSSNQNIIYIKDLNFDI